MLSTHKPYSQACENNKDFILEILRQYLVDGNRVLEIGSGTGQHALYFANSMADITWQPSDLEVNHSGIKLWLQDSINNNILPPLLLNVCDDSTESDACNAIFTANTMHIMSWDEVLQMISLASKRLVDEGLLIAYGPFNINGEYTSKSNRSFDQHLKSVRQQMGIRDLEDVVIAAMKNKLHHVANHDLPAKNKIIVFRKTLGDETF